MKLSIITPAFNAQATLQRTLQSLRVINESHRASSVQAILVDDGSTDQTHTIAQNLLPQLGLASYEIIQQQNAGSAASRNRALEAAAGDWVYLLDADDELISDPLPLLEKHKDRSLIACPIRFVKNDKPASRKKPRLIKPGKHLHALSAENPYCPASLLLKRDRIDIIFKTQYKGREDWAFLMDNPRLFESMTVAPKNFELAHVHIHGQNKSSRYEWQGQYRAQIARDMLDKLDASTPAIINNNFRIQEAIGLIQQRKPAGLSKRVRLPANPTLLLKLIIWKLSAGNIGWIDHYG